MWGWDWGWSWLCELATRVYVLNISGKHKQQTNKLWLSLGRGTIDLAGERRQRHTLYKNTLLDLSRSGPHARINFF